MCVRVSAECPPASDGMERFACPTADYRGRYRCIDDHMLCNGYRDCPGSEDEDRKNCMFYKTVSGHLCVCVTCCDIQLARNKLLVICYCLLEYVINVSCFFFSKLISMNF